MRLRLVTILVAIAVSVVAISSALGSRIVGGPQAKLPPAVRDARRVYVPDELLVKFKNGTQAKSIAGVHRALGAEVIKRFRFIGVDHVKLPEGLQAADAVAGYRASANVEYAEPNYYRYAQALPSEPVIPTDPRFSDQWALHNTGQSIAGTAGVADADIDAPEAWRYPTSGQEVVVAILDTGVGALNPDLAAEVIWENPNEIPGNATDDDGNGRDDDTWGWDFVDDDADPMDPDMHGTHVAGIIGALHDNSFGVAGAVPGVKILPVRVLDALSMMTVADALEPIDYVKDLKDRGNPIWVVNISWGAPEPSQSERDALGALGDSGILVCAAAGNSGIDNDADPSNSNYPSSYDLDNIIAVAASDSLDQLAESETWGSHWGATTVDLTAPGAVILSSFPYRVEEIETFDETFDWTQAGSPQLWGIEDISGNNVLSDSVGVSYENNSDSLAYETLALDLSETTGVQIAFDAMFDLFPDIPPGGFYDRVTLELSDGGAFTPYAVYRLSPEIGGPFDSIIGRSMLFSLGQMDHFESEYIPDFDASQLNVGFRFVSDAVITGEGIYIDNLEVRVFPDAGAFDGTELMFMSGTSMASPMVAGAAAFLKMVEPGLDYAQIKALILDNVDPIDMPEGKETVTNGRLNLHNAVRVIDYDEDGLILEDELEYDSDPHSPDTDDDGLNDGEEVSTYGTDPNDDDSDGDGLPDGWEVDNDLDPNDGTGVNGADGDPDGDEYTNLDEYEGGSDPQDENSVPPVTAAFRASPTSGQVPVTVDFTDESTGDISSWSWDFGDGGSSTAQNPSHTYTSTGDFTVSLTVSGPAGSNTETKTDYIHVSAQPVPPVADFSASLISGNRPLAVDFTDESNGTVTSWSWDFGDGYVSTEENPSHTYYFTGDYTVTLTVSGPVGSDSQTAAVHVDQALPAEGLTYKTFVDDVKVTYSKPTCFACYNHLQDSLLIAVWGDEPGVLTVVAKEDAPLVWNDRCDVYIDAPDTYIKKAIAKGIQGQMDLYVCGQADYVKIFILKDGYVGDTLEYGQDFGLGSGALDPSKKVLIKRGAATAPVLGVSYPDAPFDLTPVPKSETFVEPELADYDYDYDEEGAEAKAGYVFEYGDVKVLYSKPGCTAFVNATDGTLTIQISDSDGDLLVKCGDEAYLDWGDFCDIYVDAPDASVNAMILKGRPETQLRVAGEVDYVKSFKLKYGSVGDTEFYGPDFGLYNTSLVPPNKILIKWGWATAPVLGVSN